MSTKTRFNNLALVAFSVALVSLVVFSAVVARATSKDDIIYPVAQLGGCKSEAGCRAYCEQRDNAGIIRACLAFAKKHSLLPAEVIARGEKFADVAALGGPGGCRDEKSCVSYCDTPAHMSECLDFAIRYKLIPSEELSEAQKVLGALKSGLTTPGACARKDECVAYCENPAHIDECLLFAEKAGLLPPDEIAEAKKVAPFLKSGQTPGKCASKAACETYCANDAHFEECISFAQKAGFVGEKEAEFAKKFKGKSPGDCAKGLSSAAQARRACTEFCNNPLNQPVCFRFAHEAGIMTAEETTQAGSLSDFQACVPQAPQEIQQCFITSLGPELFESMKQGVLPLDGDVAGMMEKIREARVCVNRYADRSLETFTDDPDALSCINSELGTDYLKRASRGEVKCGDAAPAQKKIASCIEAGLGKKIDRCFSLACSEATTCLRDIQKQSGGTKREKRESEVDTKPEIFAKLESKINACVAEDIHACLAKDCSEAMSCIERIQGGAQGEAGEGKGASDPSLEAEITAKFTACAKQEHGGAPSQHSEQRKTPEDAAPGYPRSQAPGGSSDEIPITPGLCANFASVPACGYAGPPDSQNYQLCKKCYPDR